MRTLIRCVMAIAFSMTMTQNHNAFADTPLVFVTAYAAGEKGAIHAYQLDLATAQLNQIHKTMDVELPYFLAVSPNNKFLYSLHTENSGDEKTEYVVAFELVGRTGQLKFLGRQPALGTSACYLDVDTTGRTVLVANYRAGSVASFPVRDDGSLSEASTFVQHEGSSVDPARQEGPHAHSIVVSPDNRFAFVADLGLDQVLGYRLDAATAGLSPNAPPFVKSQPGAGPRHLTFHPNGKKIYVINELADSVTMFDYDETSGTLTPQQTISTLPKDFDGSNHCADLKITPSGRFLYGTNRGHDSIAAYQIGDDGRLTLLSIQPSLGGSPQNLAITGDGKLLLCANISGNNVVVFRIDAKTGALTSVGDPVPITSPSCIMIR